MSRSDRVFAMTFASVYPLYVQKVERKGRTRQELDEVLIWLTGYPQVELDSLKQSQVTLRKFIYEANINADADKITGVICGYRVEEIEDPLMQKIRWMDKVVDEVAKGKALSKIMRT